MLPDIITTKQKQIAEIGFLTLIRLQNELSVVLKRPVDLVPKLGLKPIIRQDVLAEAELLYAA